MTLPPSPAYGPSSKRRKVLPEALQRLTGESGPKLSNWTNRNTHPCSDSRRAQLDHVVLQVDDLNTVGDWYDQFVSLAGGTRTFDMPALIGYALPDQPAQLFFSLATDPGGRQTHLALRVENEATVRRGHELATALGAEILHGPRLWPEYGPGYYAVFIRDPAGNNFELKCQA
jgi:catechol 2,3-dioxygenase-like lactoylglutathione lyase family enzyme